MSWGSALRPEETPRLRECWRAETLVTSWWIERDRRVAGDRNRRMRPYLEVHMEVGEPFWIRWLDGPHGEQRWTHGGAVRKVRPPARTGDPFKEE